MSTQMISSSGRSRFWSAASRADRRRAALHAAAAAGIASAVLASAPTARAADKFYDTSATAGLQSGAGTWDLATTSAWSTAAAGTALTTFDAGDDALFQTAGASAVTVAAGGVSALTLNSTVNATAPTFSGTGTITLTSTGTTAASKGSAIFNANTATLVFNNTGGLALGGGAGSTQTINITGGNISTGAAAPVTGSGVTLSLVGTGGKTVTFGGTVSVGGLTVGGTTTATSGLNTYVFNNTVSLDTAASLAIADADVVVRLGSANASTFGTGNLINVTAGTLQFGNAASLGNTALTVAGGTLDSNTANLVLSTTTNAITLNGTTNFTGTQNLSLGTNAVSLGAAAGTSRTIAVNANTLTIGGTITNGATATGITKTGVGTLALNGANNFTGPSAVSGGVLRFGTSATVPAGAITINLNGAVAATGPAGFTTFNEWLSSGRIANTSAGSLAITGNDSSAIDLAAAGYNSLSIGSTGNFTYNGTLTPGTNGYRLGGGGGTLTVPIALDAPTTLTTGGNVTLTAANAYTGLTSVGGGHTLTISNASALGTVGTGTTVNGGTVALPGGLVVSEPLTLTAVSSTGSATNLPNGLVGTSGNNEWAGPITGVAAGGNNFRVSSATSGGTLTLSGGITGTGAFNLTSSAGTGIVFVGAGNINVTSVIAGPMSAITTSTGLVTLGDSNTFTGGFRFQGSAPVVVTSIGSIGSATPTSLGQPATAAAATLHWGAGGSAAAGTLRYVGATGETTDRPISLSGDTGTATLEQAGGGLLKFTGAVAAPGTGAKTLVLGGSTAGTGELAGSYGAGSGTNALSKTGSGTWTLSGANAYTGATTIGAGTLLLANASAIGGAGAVAVNGTGTLGGTGGVGGVVTVSATGKISPGTSPGVLSLSAAGTALTFGGATTSVVIDLDGTGGPGVGGGHDQVRLTAAGAATAALNGTDLVVNNGAGGAFPAGTTFVILDNITTGAAVTGTFADGSTVVDQLGNPYQISYAFNNGGATPASNDILLTAVPEPAAAGLIACAVGTGLLRRRRPAR